MIHSEEIPTGTKEFQAVFSVCTVSENLPGGKGGINLGEQQSIQHSEHSILPFVLSMIIPPIKKGEKTIKVYSPVQFLGGSKGNELPPQALPVEPAQVFQHH